MLEGASTLTSQESHGWECSWPLSLSFRQATVFSFVQVLKLSSSLNQIHAHIYLHVFRYVCVCVVVVVVLVTQSCPTLCNPVDWSPPGFSVPGISQARILELGCHFLLQGIFLTQGSPTLQVDSLPLSHQGNPYVCVHTHKRWHLLVKNSSGPGVHTSLIDPYCYLLRAPLWRL